METLTRKLVNEQLILMEKIKAKAQVNMVECSHCGTLLLHSLEPKSCDSVVCYGCLRKVSLSDCQDFLYEGLLNNAEFNT